MWGINERQCWYMWGINEMRSVGICGGLKICRLCRYRGVNVGD